MTTTGSASDPSYSSSRGEDGDMEHLVHNTDHPSEGKRLLLVSVACAQNILAGGLIIGTPRDGGRFLCRCGQNLIYAFYELKIIVCWEVTHLLLCVLCHVSFVAVLNQFIGTGWAGISDSILVAPISEGGAGLDLDATASIFATASAVSFVSPFFLGYVLDRFGPRCCSVLCHAFVCIGCLAFSRSGVEDDDGDTAFVVSDGGLWVWWGANLVAFAGPGFQSSAVHLSNLFPERRYLVMSSVTGTITLSFGVFSLLNVLWDSFGIGMSTLFRWYGAMMVVSTMVAAALFPDVPFEEQQQQQTGSVTKKWLVENEGFGDGGDDDGYADERLDVELVGAGEAEMEGDDGGDSELVRLSPSISKPKLYGAAGAESADDVRQKTSTLAAESRVSFHEQLRSGPFIRMTILFVVTSFWANFYVGSVTVELEDHHRIFTRSQLHHLIASFNFLSSLGFLSSPVVGYLLDSIGFVRAAAITLSLGVLQQVLLLLPSFPHSISLPSRTELVLLLSFACYSLFRSFLYPYFFACLSKKMGLRYLGILSGIAFALSGFVQFAAMGQVELWAGGTCHSDMLEQHRIEMKISRMDEDVGADVDERWTGDGPEWRQRLVATGEANGALVERDAPCDVGRWDALHWAQLVSLLALAGVPLLDFLMES